MMKRFLMIVVISLMGSMSAQAALIGYADVVLDYFDSGAGPIAGPYGGTFPGAFPTLVSLDVVLEDDPGAVVDFLSLPTGSYITVGFTDETVIDGVGNDIFIQEVGAQGERAEVWVSANLVDFFLLGIANDSTTTAFDLATIGFTDAVQAIKIVGLDSLGGSPGFDVVNIQVLPGSIGEPPVPSVPAPSSILLLGLGLIGLSLYRKKKVHHLNP